MRGETKFKGSVLEHFPFEPTQDQVKVIDLLGDYLFQKEQDHVFILRGYAGTGKTTLTAAVVKALRDVKMNAVLMAPTGRAAKVLASYSKKRANTIHRSIYFFTGDGQGNMKIKMMENKSVNTLFIVDESSMIPDVQVNSGDAVFNRDILEDLLRYVYEAENCKILFIGDTAQLPPVGLDISPALNPDYLRSSYGFYSMSYEMKEVLRQSADSGILENATHLRNKLTLRSFDLPFFNVNPYQDIVNLPGNELEELLHTYFGSDVGNESVVITRSNKRANIYNQEIRRRILFRENQIERQDKLMIVKNNYFWLPEESKAGFIANGDTIEIVSINSYQNMYGFQFADITMRMLDYPNEPDYDVKIMLDTIMLETPALPYPEQRTLFDKVMEDYSDIRSKRKRIEAVKKDPYFNALQVKFAYALTCHKTQGGQWPNVFVDQGYFVDDMLNEDYLRWMYTALTRGTDRVYLINFKKDFYSEL
jgi:exodeoxyribonuclease-5